LRRIERALRPGGVVAVWDLAPPPGGEEPDLVAEAFSLLFQITSASSCRPPAELAATLDDIGFTDVRIRRKASPTHVLVAGTKP